jgi:hypothetical protein
MPQTNYKQALRQKMKAPLAWLRRFFSRVIEVFPITWLGLFIGAAAGLSLWLYGLQRLDLLLLVTSAGAFGLLALCLISTSLSALIFWLSLRRKRSDKPLYVDCGSSARTGFSLSGLWFLPFMGIRWRWLSPEAEVSLYRERGRLHEMVRPTRRGLYEEITRVLEVYDLLGLTKITLRCAEQRQLKFTPSTGALRQVEIVRSIASGDANPHPRGALDGDRFDMRHYSPGDPLRFVLWKVFAKSRDLMVRTPERALSPARQTAAYVVAGQGDEPAAGAARAALEAGAFGQEWVLGADSVETYAKSKVEALELLTRSGTAKERDFGAGLEAFLRKASPGGVGRAVVFVPAFHGPWVPKVLAAVQQRATHGVSFVVCADAVMQPERKRRLLSRLLWKQAPSIPGARSMSELKQLLKVLQRANATCMVIDRQRGQVFSAQHLVK